MLLSKKDLPLFIFLVEFHFSPTDGLQIKEFLIEMRSKANNKLMDFFRYVLLLRNTNRSEEILHLAERDCNFLTILHCHELASMPRCKLMLNN